MGEKGNAVAAAEGAAVSVTERATSVTVGMVEEVGGELRARAVEVVADHVVDETRERLRPGTESGDTGDGDEAPPSS